MSKGCSIHSDRLAESFQRKFPHELRRDLVSVHVVVDGFGEIDLAGWRHSLDSRRGVDGRSEDVSILDQDISGRDCYSDFGPSNLSIVRLRNGDLTLKLDAREKRRST